MHWLSYGAGANSTALAILLHRGEVAGVGDDWQAIFADTGDEQDATYEWLEKWGKPWFLEIGKPLVVVRDKETVYERWWRLQVIGARRFRACTDHAKIRPIARHLKETPGVQLIGIDAGEAHRARRQDGIRYPLVEMDIDRDDCVEIIESAGISVPEKSGCWHCPFMRVAEIIEMARSRPELADKIEALEKRAELAHDGYGLFQVGNHPIQYWRERAHDGGAWSDLPLFAESEPPCGCYDG